MIKTRGGVSRAKYPAAEVFARLILVHDGEELKELVDTDNSPHGMIRVFVPQVKKEEES